MELLEKLKNIRRTIHKNPELSTKEFKTSELVERILKQNGIKTTRICNTGIIGVLEGKKKSNKKIKTICLRADLDALPIEEKNTVNYKSNNKGIMHACGHDGNTTIMLGAAIILSRQVNNFSGRVQFLFQPDEERSTGAKSVISSGILTKNKVDYILGVHVSPWTKSGKVALKYGAMMAGVDKFTIEIKGLGGHGACPHLSKDSIVAASQFIVSLQTIVSRVINPVEPAVVTVGTIEGGKQYNIIADKVTITGTVRTFNTKTREVIMKEIKNRLEAIKKEYDIEYKMKYESFNTPLINDSHVVDICKNVAVNCYGKNNVEILENPLMAGEDFAEYLKKVKGCFIYIGTAKNKSTSYPWHHEKFDLDENVLPKASKYITDIVKTITEEI